MPAPTPMPASVALSKDRLARGQVLQAQIDVSVSRAQSLVSSWLPARTAAPVDDEYSDNDDDEAVFKPAPPRHSPLLLSMQSHIYTQC